MEFFSVDCDHIHEEPDQLKRIKSALKLKMDSIDFDNRTGKIKDYEVSLDRCTCIDFGRRHKPCKHIYRLALELGIFNAEEKAVSNISTISVSKEDDRNGANNNSRCFFSYQEPIPKSFVVIDFETANKFPNSICQIGIIKVENNLIVERKNFFVRPPYKDFIFTKVHGIAFEDVRNEPTFNELWQEIKRYVEDCTIATYNLSFDINCLLSTLDYYKISYPSFKAFDILSNVRSCRYLDCELSELENYKLNTVAKRLELTHKAHDALSDALVAAQIQIYISKKFSEENTIIYYPTLLSFVGAIAKNLFSTSALTSYCYELFKNEEITNYEEYKGFFKLLEQVAAQRDSAKLYKYCGMFYEKFNRMSRAILLYKKAFDLNENIGLKGKIKKLEKELRG